MKTAELPDFGVETGLQRSGIENTLNDVLPREMNASVKATALWLRRDKDPLSRPTAVIPFNLVNKVKHIYHKKCYLNIVILYTFGWGIIRRMNGGAINTVGIRNKVWKLPIFSSSSTAESLVLRGC